LGVPGDFEKTALPGDGLGGRLRIIELSGADHVAKQRRDLEAQLAAAIDRVAKTEAKTERGRAVKARLGVAA
jgi:hypothetical protein